jgi:F-type H+-transporting ATPase subunit b
MDLILKQLGELLLGSIPTMIFLLLLFGVYTFLVHRPLAVVLAERRSKTEGAVEKARADLNASEARAAEYEQRLREARLLVYKAQETRRAQAQQNRANVTAAARESAQKLVEEARAGIEKDKVTAQTALQAESANLATEIIRTVLQPAPSQAPMRGQ